MSLKDNVPNEVINMPMYTSRQPSTSAKASKK